MGDVLRSYHLHGRWFAVDNDTYYMGTDSQNLSEIAGKWPLVRTWMSMVGLSCGTAITSDPLYRDSFKPYWRNMEVMTPPARERTEVLDLGTGRDWPRLLGRVQRAWGDSAVALLWNPGVTEQAVTLDFTQAGLNPRHRYAVWSFWDNRFLGGAQGAWTTQILEPLASQQLCFTDLDHTPDNPVLVGSNLHIYCGAAEIQRVTSGRGSMAIELTDAGAREGDLFIYSRLPLLLKSAIGCAVTGVTQAGEHVWRISLAERQRGVPQRLDLTDLPQQTPTWVLPSAFRHDLFLAFKEVLNNIVKHAAAHEVQLTLSVEPRQFRLVVRDDGRGLPAEPVPAADANGLRNMRERMARLGGECRVASTPGQGTMVEFLVPASPIVRNGNA